jgi:SAM-dependent methyltransferase
MPGEDQYTGFAPLYDAIYHWKDYRAEAARLRSILHEGGVADGADVVEAACGTGTHLSLLSEHFRVGGFDLHEEMLAVARGKAPTATLWQADMTRFRVERPQDALLCLFSSIGYLRDRPALSAAAACFAEALRPGGLLVVEPWFTPDRWTVGRPSLQTFSSPDLHIARASVGDRDGDTAIMDMHWLVARSGHPVEHRVDRHEMWLCPRDVMLSVFDEVGFDARFEPDGLMKDRGLVLGRRR